MSLLALARGCVGAGRPGVTSAGARHVLAAARSRSPWPVGGRPPCVMRWKSSSVTTATTTASTPPALAEAAVKANLRQANRRARASGLLHAGGVRVARLVRVKRSKPADAARKKVGTVVDDAAAVAADQTHRLRNSLVLRFSNENSYLNWARNGVLSSGVGVAMYAQEHHRGAQLSGAGLLLLGFGYIGVGTAKYIYYILRFRHVMELSWGSVVATISHASVALIIWLTATASFLESVPLELDAMLLTEPIISFLPFRIRQGLIETYSLYLDDLEHHMSEQDRVLRAIRSGRGEGDLSVIPEVVPEMLPK